MQMDTRMHADSPSERTIQTLSCFSYLFGLAGPSLSVCCLSSLPFLISAPTKSRLSSPFHHPVENTASSLHSSSPIAMASLAMASSVSVAATASSFTGARVSSGSRTAAVSVKMAPVRSQAKSDAEVMQRRALVAGAAAAALVLFKSASAEAAEPKKGSKEAKKKFANICVSQPTASICHG